jgi:hypothetical protein
VRTSEMTRDWDGNRRIEKASLGSMYVNPNITKR